MSDTLLAEVASFLNVESIGAEDALTYLVDFQRSNHPDRFQDASAQHAAGERFRKATDLIERLRKSIEQSAAGLMPTNCD